MSDHWKSLADRLGAPSFEPSVRRARDHSAPATVPTSLPPGTPSSDDAENREKVVEPVTASRHLRQASAADTSQSVDRPRVRSAVEPQASTSPVPRAERDKNVSSEGARSGGFEQKSNEIATPSAVEPEKKKKRSNWERVANLFGLGPEPEPDPEPVQKIQPVEASDRSSSDRSSSDRSSSDRSSSDRGRRQGGAGRRRSQDTESETRSPAGPIDKVLFDPSSSQDDKNPVLEEMFGHGPSTYADVWERPKRIVDDVGWEVPSSQEWDESTSGNDLKLESPIEDAPEGSDSGDASAEEDAPRRRSRRRRGRGRRSDGPVARTSEDAELGQREEEATEASDFIDDISEDLGSEVSESAVPERRSSRRSRFRRPERSDQPSTEAVRHKKFDEESADLNVEDSLDADDSASRSELDQDVEPSAPGRRRRRRRSRGPARSERFETEDQLPEDHEGPEAADEISEMDDIDDDDDDLQAETRTGQRTSRNIPTWEETLSVLVAANIENHRRNENRGPRGGGRSRGRR